MDDETRKTVLMAYHKRKQEEINNMQNEITTLIYFLSNLNNSILLKKLDNLGFQEFEKKKDFLNISLGDILLVKDLDIVSDKTIREIKGKVNVIFYKKPISKKVYFNFLFHGITLKQSVKRFTLISCLMA